MHIKHLLLFLIVPLFTFSQMTENEDKGQPHFKVFWNYNYDFSDDVQQNSAFELKRVYLGYKYKFDEKISAKITYDIGKNDAGSNYTAFVKIAPPELNIRLACRIRAVSIALLIVRAFANNGIWLRFSMYWSRTCSASGVIRYCCS